VARSVLIFGLFFIGAAAILIGAMFVTLGVKTTASVFNALLSLIHDGGVMSGIDNANADSELRFYSVIFIGFGIVMVQTAQNLSRHMSRVPFLLLLFFGGGVARLISYIIVGTPHSLFMVLMAVELVMPVVLGVCYLRIRRKT
jgi:hypothetical protein